MWFDCAACQPVLDECNCVTGRYMTSNLNSPAITNREESAFWTVRRIEQIASARLEMLDLREKCLEARAALLTQTKESEYYEHIVSSRFEKYKRLFAQHVVEVGLAERPEALASIRLEIRHPSEIVADLRKKGIQADETSQAVCKAQVGLDAEGRQRQTPLHDVVSKWERQRDQQVTSQRPRLERLEKELAAMCVAGAPLEKGAGADDVTPFVLAVKVGAVYCARILARCGADIDRSNALCFHPMLVAAEESQNATFGLMCDLHRQRGDAAEFAKYTGKGYTALHFAAINNNPGLIDIAFTKCEDAYRAVVDYLSSEVTTGNDNERVQARHVWRQTALHKAVIYGHLQCVRRLLHYGADPNAGGALQSGAVNLPLHSAVVNKDLELTKLLLQSGADPRPVVAHLKSRGQKNKHGEIREETKEEYVDILAENRCAVLVFEAYKRLPPSSESHHSRGKKSSSASHLRTSKKTPPPARPSTTASSKKETRTKHASTTNAQSSSSQPPPRKKMIV